LNISSKIFRFFQTSNCRDICSTINFVEGLADGKAKAAALRAKHTKHSGNHAGHVCSTLAPSATLPQGRTNIDLDTWLRKGLPTALYTLNADTLANISDRLDKFILFVYATIANLYRVFGKGNKLPQIAALGGKYATIVSQVNSHVAGVKHVAGFKVVDLYDQSLARLAEALFIKARVVDIPVFVPFKESYTPAELKS
jgi:hypothetical protein